MIATWKIPKQVFKERQPFQVKTPPTATLLQATKLTKTTNMRLFPNENNSAAATSSFKAKGKFCLKLIRFRIQKLDYF